MLEASSKGVSRTVLDRSWTVNTVHHASLPSILFNPKGNTLEPSMRRKLQSNAATLVVVGVLIAMPTSRQHHGTGIVAVPNDARPGVSFGITKIECEYRAWREAYCGADDSY